MYLTASALRCELLNMANLEGFKFLGNGLCSSSMSSQLSARTYLQHNCSIVPAKS